MRLDRRGTNLDPVRCHTGTELEFCWQGQDRAGATDVADGPSGKQQSERELQLDLGLSANSATNSTSQIIAFVSIFSF